MCILFLYVGSKDDSGDYSLILASNRDEYYDRPASNMVSWEEDPSVYGGTVCVYIVIYYYIILITKFSLLLRRTRFARGV